jgi:hypothetical protein
MLTVNGCIRSNMVGCGCLTSARTRTWRLKVTRTCICTTQQWVGAGCIRRGFSAGVRCRIGVFTVRCVLRGMHARGSGDPLVGMYTITATATILVTVRTRTVAIGAAHMATAALPTGGMEAVVTAFRHSEVGAVIADHSVSERYRNCAQVYGISGRDYGSPN